jgi:polar amino acid transport system permease protein
MSQTIASSTYRPVESFAVAGAIYFIMTYAIGKFGLFLERRLKIS